MATKTPKTKSITEFGDFQTPDLLAAQACAVVARHCRSPGSIVEPTCGVGAFLLAALHQFPSATRAFGMDINADYVEVLRKRLNDVPLKHPEVVQGNFFETDWPRLLKSMPEPLLIVGNPPWVTNAQLGAIGSTNLPEKSNFQSLAGFDALTGKSNFDISEWMLIRLLEWLGSREATVAMLCKSMVARKVLTHAWRTRLRIHAADMFTVDAAEHFGASVEACLLVCSTGQDQPTTECRVWSGLEASTPEHFIGFRDGQLIADVRFYDKWKHLQGESHCEWRSGVKHDCSGVMELRLSDAGLQNGLGEPVDIEDTFLFPMLKSSDLASSKPQKARRFMLVTQSRVGEDTNRIATLAPKTWNYLNQHAERLDRRGSIIYKKRPRFSVFGIGPYTFAPWKVAISGFYKSLEFQIVGPEHGKPVVLDDTANFVPCASEAQARHIASLLNSTEAREFFESFVFWDNKRPVTVELLKRLNLQALAKHRGAVTQPDMWLRPYSEAAANAGSQALAV
jgi:hypothetical protein